MFCCADVLSRMFCSDVGDGKSCYSTLFLQVCFSDILHVSQSIILQINFCFILDVLFRKFSPHDKWCRETVNGAGQIQNLTLLHTCIPRDFNLHIYETKCIMLLYCIHCDSACKFPDHCSSCEVQYSSETFRCYIKASLCKCFGKNQRWQS